MSLGIDALFLVALCGCAGWLLQRRQRADARARRLPASNRANDSWAELRPGAVISQGPGGDDFVVTQVERLPSDAPLTLLCHLDGGGLQGQALLVIPRDSNPSRADSGQVWLLHKLPRSSFWHHGAAEPPLHCVHEGGTFALAGRFSDDARPGAPPEDRRRIATYRGPGERWLLLWHWGGAEHAYAGREQPLRSLEILPSQ